MNVTMPGVVVSAVRLALLLCVALAPEGVQAQDQAASPGEGGPSLATPRSEGEVSERYTRAASLGFQEYELGNYVEARARFREAHEVYPNARSFRLLGKVEYDLKNYRSSIRYLEGALTSEERPLDASLRADVQGLLDLARSYVATYTVSLSPEGALLEVDGSSVQLDAHMRLQLEVGEHTLYAHAEGYRPQRKTVEVIGGNDASVELRLDRLAVDTSLGVADTRHGVTEVSRRRRRGWVIGSVVAVLLAGTATAVALSLRGTRVEEPYGGTTHETLVADF